MSPLRALLLIPLLPIVILFMVADAVSYIGSVKWECAGFTHRLLNVILPPS